jgi:hypothetical protein
MATIHISKKDNIANLSVFELRRYLHSPAIYSGVYSAEDMADYLKIPLVHALAVTHALFSDGLAQIPGSDSELEPATTSFELTTKGEELRRAKGSKPVARAAADKALMEMIARAEEVNASDDYLMSITHIAVFGSYVSEKDPIGDLDVAYAAHGHWGDIDSTEFSRLLYAHYRRIKGGGGDFMKVMEFPSRQVDLKMKNRVRMISIEPWVGFMSLLKKQPEFRYRVVFGDETKLPS